MVQFSEVKSFVTERFSARAIARELTALKGTFKGMLAQAVDVIRTQLDRIGRKCVPEHFAFQSVSKRKISKWNLLGKIYHSHCSDKEKAAERQLKALVAGLNSENFEEISQQHHQLSVQIQNIFYTIHGERPTDEQFRELFDQLCTKAGFRSTDYLSSITEVEKKVKQREIEGYMRGLILAGKNNESKNATEGYRQLRHAINQYFYQFEGSYPTTGEFNEMISNLCELIGWEPDRHREELFKARKPELRVKSQRVELTLRDIISNLKNGNIRNIAQNCLQLRDNLGAKLLLEREGRSFSAEDLAFQAGKELQKREIIESFESEMQNSLQSGGEAFSILKSLYELANKNYSVDGRELNLLGYAGEEAVVSVDMVPRLFSELIEHYFPGGANREQRKALKTAFIRKVEADDPSLKYTDMLSMDFQAAAAKG